jgi:hydrogenase maturation protease
MNCEGRIQIIAVGNPLCGDDGIGPAVLQRLRAMGLPNSVGLVDAGSDPLDAVRFMLEAEKVVIIDAADMGREAGHIAVLSPQDLNEALVVNPLSTHRYGVAEGLELIRALGYAPMVKLVGIQPGDTSPNSKLSPAVAAGVPEVIKIVMEEVAS